LKKYKLGIIKISIVLSYHLIIGNSFAQNIRPTNFDQRPACEQTGGVWRQYGNSCNDNCQSRFEQYPNCLNSITYNCDCGPNHCWNGDKCLTNREYKITFERLKRKKLQEIANQKDQEGKLKKSHQNQDPSLFSVIADKVKAPINSIIKKDPKPEETKAPTPVNNIAALPTIQPPVTTTSPVPTANNPIFSVPPVFNQLMDQKAARQLDKAASDSIVKAIGSVGN
jgi:hypothetical protein